MKIIFIPSGSSLERLYEEAMEYLFDPHTPADPNHTLTPQMEQDAHFAEAYLAEDT